GPPPQHGDGRALAVPGRGVRSVRTLAMSRSSSCHVGDGVTTHNAPRRNVAPARRGRARDRGRLGGSGRSRGGPGGDRRGGRPTGEEEAHGCSRVAHRGAGRPRRGRGGVHRRPAPPAVRRGDRHAGQAVKLLMTASQINGLPVVTVRSGEDVAEVRDVIYDPEAGRLVGLTLNKRGFFSGRRREVLPAEEIHAIGRDAVMVLDEHSLVAPDDAPDELAHPAGDRNVLGNDVLTEGGVSLGVVRDLALLVGGTGEVVGYRIERAAGGAAYIPLPAQLAVSGAALVVPDLTEDFVRDDLVGLGAAVDDFRARLGLSWPTPSARPPAARS